MHGIETRVQTPSTDCDAKFSSSSSTQSPAYRHIDRYKTMSLAQYQRPSKMVTLVPQKDAVAPCKATRTAAVAALSGQVATDAIMSVCSLRLMRTTRWPEAAAMAWIRVVLPTPGLPSCTVM